MIVERRLDADFAATRMVDHVDLPVGLDPHGIIARHWYGHHVGADLDPSDHKRINAATLIEVRKLWWQMRRQGVWLPAQHGIIVIRGNSDLTGQPDKPLRRL